MSIETNQSTQISQKNTTTKAIKKIKAKHSTKSIKPTQEKIVTMNLRVPLSLRRAIKLLATENDSTMVQCLTQAFLEYKKRKG